MYTIFYEKTTIFDAELNSEVFIKYTFLFLAGVEP